MKKSTLLTIIFLMIFSELFSQQWSSTGVGVENYTADYTCVYSMINFNGNLYIGGCFTSVNGVPTKYIAKFDGVNWSSVGDGLWHTANSTVSYTGIRTMTVFNGELYVGGMINQSGTTPIFNVAKWNGTTWTAVGNLSAVASGILSLCVYNNELYAGGNLWGGYNSIAKWNGSSWITLGAGIQDSNGNQGLVRDMRVYNNLLYIGGEFEKSGGVYSKNLITWNGTNFSSIGSGANGIYGVTKLGTFQSNLIVAGGFTDINGTPLNNIGGYNSSSWFPFSSGVGFPGGNSFETQPIVEHNGKMIVGGFFTTAGTIPANSIAEWDGTTWQAMGTGIDAYVGSLISYNGDLYAAGKFSIAGGVPVNNIAKWTTTAEGIEEVTSNEKVSIFPNPTHELLNIKLLENKININKITLLNSLGSAIYSTKNFNSNIIQLNLEYYSSGIYFIKIETDNGIIIQKIIKV